MLAVARVAARRAPRAGRGCAGARVSAASSKTRRPRVEVAQRPSRHAAAGRAQRLVVLVADGELRVVDLDGAGADQHRVAQRPQPVGVDAGRRGEETQRLVPSAAALRPSRVVANFQVTNGRPCSIGEGPRPVERARLVARAARARPRRRRRAGWPLRPAATGLGSALGEHDPAYAGLDQRLGARAGAAGVVARLEGDDGGRAAGARRRPRASASASACGRAGAAVEALARPSAPSASSSTQPTRGLGPSGTPGVRGERRARAASRRCSAAVKLHRRRPSGPAHGLRGRRRRSRRDTDAGATTVRALPIRTLTVGPGVPPGQPATGCRAGSRTVHRRFGVSPTPEHASFSARRRKSATADPAHPRR